jgi:mRNA interferase HigB
MIFNFAKNWIRAKKLNYVKDEFPNSRLISGNRVIFNIRGNNYRLVIRVNYKYGMIWIRFVGTHKEYDKIDPLKI